VSLDPGESRRALRTAHPELAAGQLGWTTPPDRLLATSESQRRLKFADFATSMGRKPLAGLRPRRPSRPTSDQLEEGTEGGTIQIGDAADMMNKSANIIAHEDDEIILESSRSRQTQQNLRALWRRTVKLVAAPTAEGTSAVELERADSGEDGGENVNNDDSDSDLTRTDSSTGRRSGQSSAAVASDSAEDKEAGSSGEGNQDDIFFQKVHYDGDPSPLQQEHEGEEGAAQDGDTSPREEDESLSDIRFTDPEDSQLDMVELDPGVLKYFGEPLDDIYLEDLGQDPPTPRRGDDTNAIGYNETVATIRPSGLSDMRLSQVRLSEGNLDKAVEEIINTIKTRSLLTDRIQWEQTDAATGVALADFSAFNWKPDLGFFQFGGGSGGGVEASGQVFTFEKVTPPPGSPLKRRPLQRPGRAKNSRRFRYADLTRIHRT
jgi:hypothetical protein